jgi:cyclic pyranopterin phosphate synthase
MFDQFGRDISYLRLSVTDQCNLSCLYCQPGESAPCRRLSCDEMILITREMAKLGIRKVRVTGGEPLTRRDLEALITGISAIGGIEEVPMTTNGIGLAERLPGLLDAKLTRINFSLDTLKPGRYRRITGQDALDSVWKGIHAALDAGIHVKINAVLIGGVNDDEIDDFIALARDNPLEFRFIELMPIGRYGELHQEQIIRGDDILSSRPYLKPAGTGAGGVARLYAGPGFKGKVGLISPVSHAFCSDCNRVRLTCDGRLKLCLGNNGEADLMPVLRGDPRQLGRFIRDAIYHKPRGHQFQESFTSARSMRQIGG